MKRCLRGDRTHLDDTGAGFRVAQDPIRSEVNASNGGPIAETGKNSVGGCGQFHWAGGTLSALWSELFRLYAVAIVNHQRVARVPQPFRDSRAHIAEPDPPQLPKRLHHVSPTQTEICIPGATRRLPRFHATNCAQRVDNPPRVAIASVLSLSF